MTRLRLVIAFAASLAAPGCGGGAWGAYVGADRATYDAIAPEYHVYVEADAALTTEQKDRRLRTLDAWNERLLRAEKESRGGEE